MTFLFAPELVINNATYNNNEIAFRPLSINDYDLGFSELLQQLTVAKFDKTQFEQRFMEMKKDGTYYIVIAEDLIKKKIIATGTIAVEKKFLRDCGTCGHIEDIVVDSTYRGKNLGLKY
ncbi:glucosamine 6-phosphate N-acetyltransferase [Heterostelium album PN500]|uniref:Glucosamine 6-phosphate N-acetyltransferase n=1 Tax=Heterostelium pallidum (strain ATCC 26659 / Pp 5 / PN500) TaxID=670386 RepID=D3BE40_HETP5|nr:glucosamine 6-phosphate N-acetyltransferase [Heterostelium album PN500]EFA80171.1 glucosamine 6-phosphate N-acetyltransferase [Heterostelium album PN500]|eukprot:XP_020432291.1 glucosamine 6-phosphate N-acetyltransferase [Heterostelium album PN500]